MEQTLNINLVTLEEIFGNIISCKNNILSIMIYYDNF